MDWRHGLSGRMPALQAQRPKFKPQSHQKQKQTKQAIVMGGLNSF
jgi:hypothetical protein